MRHRLHRRIFAAHALDYDDMCFISLAHPSAPLVAAALVNKFRACAGRVLDTERTEAAIAMLQSLDQLADTRTLTDGLCRYPG